MCWAVILRQLEYQSPVNQRCGIYDIMTHEHHIKMIADHYTGQRSSDLDFKSFVKSDSAVDQRIGDVDALPPHLIRARGWRSCRRAPHRGSAVPQAETPGAQCAAS